MKYSVILGTLNRDREISHCLNSFVKQNEKDFEIIIIDQSNDRKTEKVVKQFSELDIHYYRVDFLGLSKARNYGMKLASGDYICLADDDAEYPYNYFDNANKYFAEHKKSILSGVILSNLDFQTQFVNYNGLKNNQIMRTEDILKYAPSAALIFPKDVYETINGFNDRLGVGNIYASGEETDYLLRAIDHGYRIVHCKKLIVYHPIKENSKNYNVIFHHAMGKGALFKIDTIKRRKKRLLVFAARNTIGMFIKSLISLKNERKLFLWRMKGFIEGVRTFKI